MTRTRAYVDSTSGHLRSAARFGIVLSLVSTFALVLVPTGRVGATPLSGVGGRSDIQNATTELLSGLSQGAKDDLASTWYDDQRNGQLVIHFVRNLNAHAAEVKARFRYPNRVDIGSAQYSLAALDRLIDQLPAMLDLVPSLTWTDVTRDDQRNLVVIHVLGDPKQASTTLPVSFRSLPLVLERATGPNQPANAPNAESPSQQGAPPVVAGLQISRLTLKPGLFTTCSSSFAVTRGSAHFMLTAGHCDVFRNQSTFIGSVGCCPGVFPLGTMAASRFQTGFSDDAGIINTILGIGVKPEVYSDGGFNSSPTPAQTVNDFWVSRVSHFLDGDDVTGAQVCDVGVGNSVRGNFCGSLISNNSTVNYSASDGFPAVRITHARIAGVEVHPGFSGGAVYANGDISEGIHYTNPLQRYCCDTQFPVHALGIVSGSTGGGNLIYTHVQYAIQDFGVSVSTG